MRKVSELLPHLASEQLPQLAVSALASDSRLVAAGGAFLAYPGERFDGRDYIDQALAAGAVLIICEAQDETAPTLTFRSAADRQVPCVALPRLQQQLSELADRFYNHPSKALTMFAVTGTNGKTSCAFYAQQLATALGETAGLIGTVGWGVGENFQATQHTTPDAIRLQEMLQQLKVDAASFVAMEVSSHALEQGRVNAVDFDVAVFTNLSHDHLDYHETMEAYGRAKQKLFTHDSLRAVVLNMDDPYWQEIARGLSAEVNCLRYSLHDATAEIYADNVRCTEDGIQAQLHTPWGDGDINVPLIGEFNLSNCLAVIGGFLALGYPFEAIIAKLNALHAAPGRMETYTATDIAVVIDYAHTPDALLHALKALREHCRGALWCVFGCGGDRDTSKRAPMGAIATHYADHIIITNDNPRSESPEVIAAEIAAGCEPGKTVQIELDRRAAIELAIRSAQAQDWVLVAGKGHEDYQLIGSQRLNFSDTECVLTAIQQRQVH